MAVKLNIEMDQATGLFNMRYDRCFITGCDEKTEWMLPWFFKNYIKHNDTPIVFTDFGVSEKMRDWVEEKFNQVYTLRPDKNKLSWYSKPSALIEVNSYNKVWLDTDCEVLGNLSPIFNHLVVNKLNLVQDRPWSRRRQEIWHNTGVVGVIGKPTVLYQWDEACRNDGKGQFSINAVPRGDQDVLHEMATQNFFRRGNMINDLPNIYNWLRIQLIDGEDKENKKLVHWTGPKGKEIIRAKMNEN